MIYLVDFAYSRLKRFKNRLVKQAKSLEILIDKISIITYFFGREFP
jgi:hypothetical protein